MGRSGNPPKDLARARCTLCGCSTSSHRFFVKKIFKRNIIDNLLYCIFCFPTATTQSKRHPKNEPQPRIEELERGKLHRTQDVSVEITDSDSLKLIEPIKESTEHFPPQISINSLVNFQKNDSESYLTPSKRVPKGLSKLKTPKTRRERINSFLIESDWKETIEEFGLTAYWTEGLFIISRLFTNLVINYDINDGNFLLRLHQKTVELPPIEELGRDNLVTLVRYACERYNCSGVRMILQVQYEKLSKDSQLQIELGNLFVPIHDFNGAHYANLRICSNVPNIRYCFVISVNCTATISSKGQSHCGQCEQASRRLERKQSQGRTPFQVEFEALTKEREISFTLPILLDKLDGLIPSESKDFFCLFRSCLVNSLRTNHGQRWIPPKWDDSKMADQLRRSKQLIMSLFLRSKQTYKVFKEKLGLPCERTVQKWISVVPSKAGINELAIKAALTRAFKEGENVSPQFLVLTDEIYIRKGILFSKSEESYTLIGFVDMDSKSLCFTNELEEIISVDEFDSSFKATETQEPEDIEVEDTFTDHREIVEDGVYKHIGKPSFSDLTKLAKYVEKTQSKWKLEKAQLASHLMLVTLDSKIAIDVGYFHLKSLTAKMVESQLCRLTYAVNQVYRNMNESSLKCLPPPKILGFVFDGSTPCRKFLRRCNVTHEGAYVYDCLLTGDKIICIGDMVHLTKRLRVQCLGNGRLMKFDSVSDPTSISTLTHVLSLIDSNALSLSFFKELQTLDLSIHGVRAMRWSKETLDVSPRAIMHWPPVRDFFGQRTCDFLNGLLTDPSMLKDYRLIVDPKRGTSLKPIQLSLELCQRVNALIQFFRSNEMVTTKEQMKALDDFRQCIKDWQVCNTAISDVVKLVLTNWLDRNSPEPKMSLKALLISKRTDILNLSRPQLNHCSNLLKISFSENCTDEEVCLLLLKELGFLFDDNAQTNYVRRPKSFTRQPNNHLRRYLFDEYNIEIDSMDINREQLLSMIQHLKNPNAAVDEAIKQLVVRFKVTDQVESEGTEKCQDDSPVETSSTVTTINVGTVPILPNTDIRGKVAGKTATRKSGKRIRDVQEQDQSTPQKPQRQTQTESVYKPSEATINRVRNLLKQIKSSGILGLPSNLLQFDYEFTIAGFKLLQTICEFVPKIVGTDPLESFFSHLRALGGQGNVLDANSHRAASRKAIWLAVIRCWDNDQYPDSCEASECFDEVWCELEKKDSEIRMEKRSERGRSKIQYQGMARSRLEEIGAKHFSEPHDLVLERFCEIQRGHYIAGYLLFKLKNRAEQTETNRTFGEQFKDLLAKWMERVEVNNIIANVRFSEFVRLVIRMMISIYGRNEKGGAYFEEKGSKAISDLSEQLNASIYLYYRWLALVAQSLGFSQYTNTRSTRSRSAEKIQSDVAFKLNRCNLEGLHILFNFIVSTLVHIIVSDRLAANGSKPDRSVQALRVELGKLVSSKKVSVFDINDEEQELL